MLDEQKRKEQLANRIKTGRIMLDVGMEEFARLIGVSKSTLWRYETGNAVPDALTMELIDGLLTNLEYQGNAYVPAQKVQGLLNATHDASVALRTIKCMIFRAVLEHHPRIVYDGMLNQKELAFLAHFGYRVEKKGSVYIIHLLHESKNV